MRERERERERWFSKFLKLIDFPAKFLFQNGKNWQKGNFLHGIEIFLAKKGILKADFWQKMFLKTSFISAKVEQIRGWKNLIGRRLMTSRVLIIPSRIFKWRYGCLRSIQCRHNQLITQSSKRKYVWKSKRISVDDYFNNKQKWQVLTQKFYTKNAQTVY